jgi:hypothetical protein
MQQQVVDRIVEQDQKRLALIAEAEALAQKNRSGSISAAWAGVEDLAMRLNYEAYRAAALSRQMEAEMGTLTLCRLGEDGRVFLRPDGMMVCWKAGQVLWVMEWSPEREISLQHQVMQRELHPAFGWEKADASCIRPH